MFGWYIVASLFFHIIYNLYFIFSYIIKIIKLMFMKAFYYVISLFDKKLKIKTKVDLTNKKLFYKIFNEIV